MCSGVWVMLHAPGDSESNSCENHSLNRFPSYFSPRRNPHLFYYRLRGRRRLSEARAEEGHSPISNESAFDEIVICATIDRPILSIWMTLRGAAGLRQVPLCIHVLDCLGAFCAAVGRSSAADASESRFSQNRCFYLTSLVLLFTAPYASVGFRLPSAYFPLWAAKAFQDD